MQIQSKTQFFKLAQKGLCGNTTRIWMSVDETSSTHIYLRSRNPGGVACVTDIVTERLPPEIERRVTLQGNLTWLDGLWILEYTRECGVLRYKKLQTAIGLSALMLLKSSMSRYSYDMLMDLMDRYENPVIEFTAYRGNAGVLQRDAVVWEIRNGY